MNGAPALRSHPAGSTHRDPESSSVKVSTTGIAPSSKAWSRGLANECASEAGMSASLAWESTSTPPFPPSSSSSYAPAAPAKRIRRACGMAREEKAKPSGRREVLSVAVAMARRPGRIGGRIPGSRVASAAMLLKLVRRTWCVVDGVETLHW
jgi:hypothetical protein